MDIRLPEEFTSTHPPLTQIPVRHGSADERRAPDPQHAIPNREGRTFRLYQRPLWKEDGGWLPDTFLDDLIAFGALLTILLCGMFIGWGWS